MIYDGKSYTKVDDGWGYPPFWETSKVRMFFGLGFSRSLFLITSFPSVHFEISSQVGMKDPEQSQKTTGWCIFDCLRLQSSTVKIATQRFSTYTCTIFISTRRCCWIVRSSEGNQNIISTRARTHVTCFTSLFTLNLICPLGIWVSVATVFQ